MGSIRARTDNGKLFIDFRIGKQRCREQTLLDDTASNRKRLQKLADQIDFEIQSGNFDYLRYFPNSKRAEQFAAKEIAVTQTQVAAAVAQTLPTVANAVMPVPVSMPTFKDFADTWYAETEVSWRKSHQRTIRDILDRRLIPEFGEKVVGQITKADIMAFRSTLAKVPGRRVPHSKPKALTP